MLGFYKIPYFSCGLFLHILHLKLHALSSENSFFVELDVFLIRKQPALIKQFIFFQFQ